MVAESLSLGQHRCCLLAGRLAAGSLSRRTAPNGVDASSGWTTQL